jgi:hypothetical protein
MRSTELSGEGAATAELAAPRAKATWKIVENFIVMIICV